MNIKVFSARPYQITIQTLYVMLIINKFFKKMNSDMDENETNLVEWFPTNFQWQPLLIYPPPLLRDEDL
jgi:hypothetical protein